MSLLTGRFAWVVILLLFVLQGGSFAVAQISPAEIINPRLKEPEQTYFHQLIALNKAIGRISYPFPFSLRRYIGLSAKNPLGNDERGLEFVLFHDQVLLKVSGNYRAAFNSALMTQNQRARRVFNDVALPILRLLPQYFSPSANFDGFGIEVAYHVQTESHAYEYEGVEILTMVFNKAAALGFPRATDEAQRQEILDESGIYVNDKRFGLALEGNEPNPPDTLEGEWPGPPRRASMGIKQHPPGITRSIPTSPESGSAQTKAEKPVSTTSARSLRALIEDMPIGPVIAPAAEAGGAGNAGLQAVPTQGDANQADLNTLERTYQRQFDALGKEGIQRYHLVSYAPPSLVPFHNQIYLQLTMRNPIPFDRSKTSIYKRAAQDFDLFLAPMLKPILDQVPHDQRIAGLDITVLNQFGPNAQEASEATEFLSPLTLLQQFANADVTSQDVINHSVVLVNGMRIGLDLQQVE